MATSILLSVKYGSDSGAEIQIFIDELEKAGWQQVVGVPGSFVKALDSHGSHGNPGRATEEEVSRAASEADLSDTVFVYAVAADPPKSFSWDPIHREAE